MKLYIKYDCMQNNVRSPSISNSVFPFVAETCWTWTPSPSPIQVTAAVFSFTLLITFNFHICNFSSAATSHPRCHSHRTTHRSTECVQFHAAIIIKSLFHAPYRCTASIGEQSHSEWLPEHLLTQYSSPVNEKLCPTGQLAHFQSSLFPIRTTNHWRMIDTYWLLATRTQTEDEIQQWMVDNRVTGISATLWAV